MASPRACVRTAVASACVVAAVVALLAAPAAAVAHQAAPFGATKGGDVAAGLATGRGADLLLDGWSSFADLWLLADMAVVMLLALGLGAAIAYHPSTRRRVTSLEHYEQPKTFLMYAVVAAVVALIVEVEPAMAFVIFGIGGLLRFRTDVGEAKDTGRVILVTVVGLCCGLKIFIVAVPATVIGWVLIHFLERDAVGIIKVSGVAEASIPEATQAYRAQIAAAGLAIIGEQTRFVRREFLFVVRATAVFDRADLLARCDALPKELRGAVDYERI